MKDSAWKGLLYLEKRDDSNRYFLEILVEGCEERGVFGPHII